MCDTPYGAWSEGRSPERQSADILALSRLCDLMLRERAETFKKVGASDKTVIWLKGLFYGARQSNCWLGWPPTILEPCLGCVPNKHPCTAPWHW